MSNYKEPWYLEYESGGVIVVKDDDNKDVAISDEIDSEVYRRVVACVNACEAISTEELEQLVAANMRLNPNHPLFRGRSDAEA